MTKYSVEVADPKKAAKASGSALRIHFKNVTEVVAAIRGMELKRAKAYLENVLEKKEAIPMKHSTGGRGRHAQSKNLNVPGSLVGWPINSVKAVLDLLKNGEANAETKGLDLAKVVVSHAQANQAPKGRRRTYRAHGRINAYMSTPSHVQLILTEKPEEVQKPKEEAKAPRLFKRKLAARFRVKVGGGVTA